MYYAVAFEIKRFDYTAHFAQSNKDNGFIGLLIKTKQNSVLLTSI